ncbi:two-component sensor histidine kinase [Azospirillum lipoferum]|uniref:histidine kinase n=2 Tax=Azospirillum lipoferum TaxID=193 RepID=A0A5A9GK53_AZOLI|nr:MULTISPECIES: PAS domain-containing sensor histidine kinase [Azospirillum]KAA0594152.1 sensor histidine kinase [Azospirillum lipoferum]MCP1612647.1 two-component sensor histidine kinase [Azospirillum lipoferum]MDW5531571.1 histidine kinase dimerization/phosphoacceptor domain -containing protein [Azospirillum sp. NL1]
MAHIMAVTAFRNAEFGTDPGADWPAGTDVAVGIDDPAMLRCLLDQMPTPTALVEGEGDHCAFANAAFRALGVVAGAGLTERFPALAPSMLAEARRTGQLQRNRATGDRSTEGERFWDVRVTPMLGVNGVVRALIVTAEETPESVAEHERRLRDVSHRLKNTLQLVSSLLTLQTLSSKDPEVRRALQSASGRVGIVTQAHQRTHGSLRAGTIDMAVHLRELCQELEATLPGAHRIQVTADATEMPTDTVIPFSLIVSELVGNAARHAFPAGAPGAIDVRLGHGEGGAIRLEVIDRGIGLPPGLDLSRATTLGLKVVRAFVGQLRGKLTADSSPYGTRVVVEFPPA